MIRLLAPSPFSFTNLGIEIAIIAVPAKAVNRKARRAARRVDHKSSSKLSAAD
jgi:hypothetical protein